MQRWILIGLIAGLFPMVGCAGSVDEPVEPSTRTEPAGETGTDTTTARGSIVAKADADVDLAGKVIVGSWLTLDGDIEMIEGARVETDASGRYDFTLASHARPSADALLLVRAFGANGELGSVIVGCGGEDVLEIPPIIIDVDVDVDVDVPPVDEPEPCTDCEEPPVDEPEPCTDCEEPPSEEPEPCADCGEEPPCTGTCDPLLADLIAAVFVAVDACESILSHPLVGASANASVAADAVATARAELELELAAATTAVEVQAAFEAYIEASINAYLDAGVTRAQLAIALHAVVGALDLADRSLNATAHAQVLANIEYLRACIVADVIVSVFAGLGSSASIVASAAAVLKADILAAASLGLGAGAAIETAWREFAAVVRAELEVCLRAQLTATIGLGVLGTIDQLCAEIFAVLDIVAAVTTDLTYCVDAVIDLLAQIVSSANVTKLMDAGLTKADAELALTVMFHLTAAIEIPAE